MSIFEFIERQKFNSSSVIFEIGAHFGIDTEKIHKLSNGAKIHCFEPDPRNLEVLYDRGIDKIAKINPVAVADKEGVFDFHLSGGNVHTGNDLLDKHEWSASNSLKAPKKHLERFYWCKFDKVIQVPTLTLDAYCNANNVEKIDLIWMDVQGAEDLVFKGAQDILRKTRFVWTEFSNEEMYEGQLDLKGLLLFLPGLWSIVFIEGEDVLLVNTEGNGFR